VITLLEPVALAAAFGLAVPFAVHWLRRADRRRLDFAALALLRERDHPRRERRLHDRSLLVLRVALLASGVLLLAVPAWRSPARPGTPWVVVASGVTLAAARGAVGADGAEWHALEPGFPLVAGAQSARRSATAVPTASLLRELDAVMPAGAALTVVVPEELGGLDAERVSLGREIHWQVLPGSSPRAAPSVRADPGLPPQVVIRYDETGRAELPVARALAAAWAAGTTVAAEPARPLDAAAALAPLPAPPGWLIWLGGPLTPEVIAWIRAGGRVLASRQSGSSGDVAIHDPQGVPLLRERVVGAGRLVTTAQALRLDAPPLRATLSDSSFPGRLARLLAAPILAPDRANANAVRPLYLDDASRRWAPPRRFDAEIAALVIVLFVLERAAAWRRRRA
jgi:hypothetical protein